MHKLKIFVYGIGFAGKTALLNTMRSGVFSENTTPTLSFLITKYITEDCTFEIWDAPGQTAFRYVWKTGYERAKLLLYVLDVANESKYEECKKELYKVLEDPITTGIPLIICFHKMDLELAQQNLVKAKAYLHPSQIVSRRVILYETSIFQQPTIEKLKGALVNIASGTMW
jgi:small GTP-binding protein